MRRIFYLLLGIALFSFSSCEEETPIVSAEEVIGEEILVGEEVTLEEDDLLSFENERAFADYCLEQFVKGDFDKIGNYFDKGEVLFSPYAYINRSTAQILRMEELLQRDEILFWGFQDGSGDSLNMSIQQYVQRYIVGPGYNKPSVKVEVLDQKPNTYGSELHNVQDIYPDSKFVEYYKAASVDGGFDWKALIFVIGYENGQYNLKAVLHNQWTI